MTAKVKGVKKNEEAEFEPKAGLASTEFWLTLLAVIAATILCATHSITADQWMTVTAGGTGAYAISRGIAKKG
jgi:hypothetical protein